MPSRQPPTQASRADQGQGDKVVRPVGRSTLSPWPWPAPRCVGRRQTGWQGVDRRTLSSPPYCPAPRAKIDYLHPAILSRVDLALVSNSQLRSRRDRTQKGRMNRKLF